LPAIPCRPKPPTASGAPRSIFVSQRLAATQDGPPRPVREAPKPCARLISNALPLHKDVVTHGYDYIFNNLRINLLRIHDDFIYVLKPDSVVAHLLGEG
jgi:hypothetical protein